TLIISFLSICFWGLLFYAPILIINGFEAVFANKFIVRYSWQAMIDECLNYYTVLNHRIIGLPLLLVVVFLMVSTSILLYLKKYKQIVIILFFIVMPIVLALATNIFPFSRVYNYYAFLI